VIAQALESWERFWFTEHETSTLALIRITFGVLMLGWAISLSTNLLTFFGPTGIITVQPRTEAWGILRWFPSESAVIALYVILLLAAICTIFGLATRLATLALFVCVISFERRNPFVFNSGDAVIRNLSFFLMLAPAGAALSLDSLRRGKSAFWTFPTRSYWPVRLMQIQLCVIYLAAVWAKVRGVTWNDGTAVSYALRIDDLARFPLPHFMATSPLIVSLATYGTLLVELSLPILVWNRKARPFVLLAGFGMHMTIDYRIMVGFFSYAIILMYLSFLPPERASAVVLWARQRLGSSRLLATIGQRVRTRVVLRAPGFRALFR
jgi:hypothetical protein